MFVKRNKDYEFPEPDKKKSGEMLRSYAEKKRAHKHLNEQYDGQNLADICNLEPATISNWITGNAFIPVHHIPEINGGLNLLPEEAQNLLEANVDLRPLNPKWLEKQPEHERGGMLLQTLCKRSGMSQTEIIEEAFSNKKAIAIGVNLSRKLSGDLPLLDTDTNPILRVLRSEAVPKMLRPTHAESVYLTQQVELSNAVIRKSKINMRNKLIQSLPPHPEVLTKYEQVLNPEWLDKQDLLYQGALIFQAFRERAGKQKVDIAAALELTPSCISQWELTDSTTKLPRPIPHKYMKQSDGSFPLADALGLTNDVERARLQEVVSRSSDQIRLVSREAAQFARTDANRLGAALTPKLAREAGLGEMLVTQEEILTP